MIDKNIKEINKIVDEYQKYTANYDLPEKLFLMFSGMMPLVNVDLLIKDKNNRTLLSWRDDEYCGIGWHIIGGVLRKFETLRDRVIDTSYNEIGRIVSFDINPIDINEMILYNRNVRNHSIAFLYKCYLCSDYELLPNKNLKENEAGYLKWFDKCPNNILREHEIYRKYIDN